MHITAPRYLIARAIDVPVFDVPPVWQLLGGVAYGFGLGWLVLS